MSDTEMVPLFLLNTVLMPGGVLPLRVFEPRYLDMLARCMRNAEPFAVVAIDSGSETGDPARPMAVGTLATIADWDQGDDGLLQVVARGSQRVRLLSSQMQADHLTVAQIEQLPDDQPQTLPEELAYLSRGLQRLLEQFGKPFSELEHHPEDALWVGNRLTDVLPLPLHDKQKLLEMTDSLARVEWISAWIRSQE